MILVDTSIWIDHLRATDVRLATLLERTRVLGHPFIIGELALGHLRQREAILSALGDLPQATRATDAETLTFIDHNRLAGIGIGYLDAHLLAATRLTPGAKLWTRDRRLAQAAGRLALAFNPG